MARQFITMQAEGVVKVSTKGQVVIPSEIRKRLGIVPGKKLLVAMGKDEILLKKVEEVSLRDVSRRTSKVIERERIDVDTLMEQAIRWARRSR